jgi:hypothetical protein
MYKEKKKVSNNDASTRELKESYEDMTPNMSEDEKEDLAEDKLENFDV